MVSPQFRNVSSALVAELEVGLRDDNSSTTSLLQKCILLGGQVGSARLRDWARQELRGYDRVDQVPEYRRISAPLCIDGATLSRLITGQQISAMSLLEFAREHISEELALTHGLGELEQISRGPEDMIRLSPPLAQDLIVLWNHKRQSTDQITRLYWQVNRSAIAGVVISVRTALAELVGELLAATPDDEQPPSKQAVDAAVHFVVTGDRNTITVVDRQTTTKGNTAIAVTGSSGEPQVTKEGWWTRWRNRGLIIGLSTVVAAVVAVLQLVGWVPWK